jgi:hypothetical protein
LQAHLVVGEHLEEFSQGDGRPASHATRIVPTHTVWQRDTDGRTCCAAWRGLEIQPVWVGRERGKRRCRNAVGSAYAQHIDHPFTQIAWTSNLGFGYFLRSEGPGELVPSALPAFLGQSLVRGGSGERTVRYRI